MRQFLTAAMLGHASAPALGSPTFVQLCFRRKGAQLARVWGAGAGLAAALHDGVAKAARGPARITQIEATLARAGRLMVPADLTRTRVNDFRGLLGVEPRTPDKVARMGPLERVTCNPGPKAALRLLSRQISLPLGAVEARAFPAEQFLMDWLAGRVHRRFRGQKTVPPGAITRTRVQDMARGMEDLLLTQIREDLALPSKYWPFCGTCSNANNMIRQFMASAALANIAARRGDVAPKVARNFAHDFDQFYTKENHLGLIHEGEKVKPGAAAALIACLNLGDPACEPQIAALARFILSMQNPDGGFRTFLRPADRTWRPS